MTPVSFTAYLSASTAVSSGQTVIFDRTVTNIGDAYNTSTDIFTFPITGVYVVMLNILSRSGEEARVAIQKEWAWTTVGLTAA